MAGFGHAYLLANYPLADPGLVPSSSNASRPRASTMASPQSSFSSPRSTPLDTSADFTTILTPSESLAMTAAAAASASTTSLALSHTSSTTTSSPDLGHEVAALSNKLIKAINHQTALEEGLEDTRHELDVSKTRIKELEKIAREHADLMATGRLVEKKEVELETMTLMNKLMEESVQRVTAEKEKKNIEMDLENLTSSLFEEANKMVIAARKEREAVIRRNDQLEQQLQDTETLLITHQEQLSELKMALQQMTSEREEMEALSTPSTPALSSDMTRIFEALQIPTDENLKPANPTSFSHLLQPVLRSDIGSYNDFVAVVRMSKNFSPTPPPAMATPNSGITGAMGGFSMGSFFNNSASAASSPGKHSRTPSTSSSFFSSHKPSLSVSSVHSHASHGSNGSLPYRDATVAPPAPMLKDTAFFKRALMEDIEPTLRLDSAPGLSWLKRREVLNAIIEGALVIEALPSNSRQTTTGCALCGENRPDATHVRTHRFRTSEVNTATRYPLCMYCAARLRSVCDFLAFLRTVKEGHWKCETEEDEKNAWEESVKLREGMFWSRVGGGVVPAFASTVVNSLKSPRSSTEGTERSGLGSAGTGSTSIGAGMPEVLKEEELEKFRRRVEETAVPGSKESKPQMTVEEEEVPQTPLEIPTTPIISIIRAPAPELPPRKPMPTPAPMLPAGHDDSDSEIEDDEEEEDNEDDDEDDDDFEVLEISGGENVEMAKQVKMVTVGGTRAPPVPARNSMRSSLSEDSPATTPSHEIPSMNERKSSVPAVTEEAEEEEDVFEDSNEGERKRGGKGDRDSQLPSPPDSPALKMGDLREGLRSESPEMDGVHGGF